MNGLSVIPTPSPKPPHDSTRPQSREKYSKTSDRREVQLPLPVQSGEINQLKEIGEGLSGVRRIRRLGNPGVKGPCVSRTDRSPKTIELIRTLRKDWIRVPRLTP